MSSYVVVGVHNGLPGLLKYLRTSRTVSEYCLATSNGENLA